MRLIDADSITEKIMNVFEEALRTALESGTFDLEGVMLKIKCYLDNQPTAFDVDKVVEQLEETREKDIPRINNTTTTRDEKVYKLAMSYAIDIVRKGGLDE